MVCLGSISYQDFKDRKVYALLFPAMLLLLTSLHFLQSPTAIAFLYHILANMLIVSALISILFVYSRLVLRNAFLNHSLGLGDILFFFAFAFGFPTITFVVLFTGSVLFSLLVFLVSKKRFAMKTVPLAGLMALFLAFVFLCSFMTKSPVLYVH